MFQFAPRVAIIDNRLGRTFQNIRLFGDQSVLDNVKIGLHNSFEYGTATGIFRLPKYFATEKEMDKKALEILSVFGLDSSADIIASNLPYRDFMTVGLLVKKFAIKNKSRYKTVSDIIPDCWIYIQEHNVKLGRLQIFNNWGPSPETPALLK